MSGGREVEYAIMRKPGLSARLRRSSPRPRRMAVVLGRDGVQALRRYACETIGSRWEVVETKPQTRSRQAEMTAIYRNGRATSVVTFWAWRTT